MEPLLVSAVAFGRNFIGIITRPYETFRRIIDHGSGGEFLYLSTFMLAYFAVSATVKTAAFRPFLMTREFVVLSLAAVLTYALAVCLFWFVGGIFGARGTLKKFALGWAYTLIPTVSWFWITSLLYIAFPPPRTSAPLGILFSVLYLLFSATLLFWKVTLSYLALRFGLRLDLAKIFIVCLFVLPMLGIYSVGMYRLGIFRIPFL